jgi:hypothetical protein
MRGAITMMNLRPGVFFLVSFILLWLGILLGSRIRQQHQKGVEGESKMISLLEGALLTLFGLLMGFTFSMAVSRYDARKELIVKEANAIGTTWLRSSTLAEPVKSQTQDLLRRYVAVRIRFLSSGSDMQAVQASLNDTGDLQVRLWAIASTYAVDHRDPITGLYLATLNDSIDATEERTAAFENRVPGEAWGLLLFIGFAATIVVGMSVSTNSGILRVLLPFVIAGALAMALDVDSPRYGLVKPTQSSMERLQQQIVPNHPVH